MLRLTDSIQHPNSLYVTTYGLPCSPEPRLQGPCYLQPKNQVLKNIFKYLNNFKAGCSNTCWIMALNYYISLISRFCDLAQLPLQAYSVCQLPQSDAPHLSHRHSMKRLRREEWLTLAISAAVGRTAIIFTVFLLNN